MYECAIVHMHVHTYKCINVYKYLVRIDKLIDAE